MAGSTTSIRRLEICLAYHELLEAGVNVVIAEVWGTPIPVEKAQRAVERYRTAIYEARGREETQILPTYPGGIVYSYHRI